MLVSIGGTAFDGAQEGALKRRSTGPSTGCIDIGLGTIAALRITNTLLLALDLAGVAAIYWAGVAGMRTVQRLAVARELARAFAHTFIPIALAYLVAHYFSLFVFQEQAQFTYILSDPLGDGSELLRHRRGRDRLRADRRQRRLVRAGRRARRRPRRWRSPSPTTAPSRSTATPRVAARSQYWMLALMVGFTSLGLFLLSQANQ